VRPSAARLESITAAAVVGALDPVTFTFRTPSSPARMHTTTLTSDHSEVPSVRHVLNATAAKTCSTHYPQHRTTRST